MTEKRFTLKYINEQHISANLYDNKTFIGSIGIGEELIVELLNNLSEENEQLKKDSEFTGLLANHRGEMIAFANSLIQDLDDETEKEMWETFKEEMWQKWKKQRGIE